MKVYKPRHSHPYFKAAELRLPKRRAGLRVLVLEQKRDRVEMAS